MGDDPGREREELSRREFCLNSLRGGLWGAGLLAAGRLGWPVRALAGSKAELAAVKGAPAEATRRAMELLGGMGRFVRPGQRVVVKPNIGWERTPDQAANTHPEVVSAVVRMCLEAGAAEVQVFDRSANDPRRSYQRSGIGAAVEGIGDRRVNVFLPDRKRYVKVPIPEGKLLRKWQFYEEALKTDVFINLPIAKHHSLCRLTMGLKNVMGVIGGNRGRMHTDFDDKIVDLNLVRPSHLVVLDATRILVDHGPQGGRLEDVRRPEVVVAGADTVAVDAYATRFFGLEPRDVVHLVKAADRGLGTTDLGTIRVKEENL